MDPTSHTAGTAPGAGSRLVAALSLALLSCGGVDGSAVVRGRLEINDCRASMPEAPSELAFEAGYLSTERYSSSLLISIQQYAVEVEETDGLVIRFPLGVLLESGALVVDPARSQIVRADPSRPLVVRTSTHPNDANAVLSLFQTCPEFPASRAVDGELTLDKLTLAAEPEDTGQGERLGGVLRATMGRASSRSTIGTVDAIFDFAPPRRPLTDFR